MARRAAPDMTPSPLRAIPSVGKLLESLGSLDVPRPVATAVVRRELAALRADKSADIPPFTDVLARVRAALDRLSAQRIQVVINGTGVLLHTNLGRAPLPDAAIDAVLAAGTNYTNLEYDLTSGERGGRASYLEHNLALLCGTEAATVVNNCAAALILILRHFTRGPKKEVVISRGELIQIGGGFRVPEILEASGARLREIGTTNQTTLADYEDALGPGTALILKIHRSNFYQEGFVGSPGVAELAALARRRRVPLVEDLGSGAFADTGKLAALEHERTPAEAVRDGVDLVCFSGDKLMGGPQAGLIIGRTRRVAALKREPFFRALRCNKLVLTALQETVDIYLRGAETEIRALEMMQTGIDKLRGRAAALAASLAGLPLELRIGEAHAQVGGGTLPRATLPSVTLDIHPPAEMPLSDFAARLRRGKPPVVGYVSGRRFHVDLRTVFPRQDPMLVQAIRSLFAPTLPKA